MTPAEFDSLPLPMSRTRSAARLVVIDGLSAYEAARRFGINASALSRYIKGLSRPRCPCCGQFVKQPIPAQQTSDR